MKKLNPENEKLILEINRINQIMGQSFLSEGVSGPLIDFLDTVIKSFKGPVSTTIDNVVNGVVVRETIQQVLDRLQQKVRTARVMGNPLPVSNVIQDLYVLGRRDNDFLIKVTDWIMGTDQGKGIREALDAIIDGVDKSKSKSQQIDDIRDAVDSGFASRGIPKGPYTNMIADRAVLDFDYNLKFPKPSLFSRILTKIPVRDMRILSNMMYDAFLPLKSQQSKFIELSNEAAEYMARTDKVPTKQLDSMLAILASTKTWWKNQPRIVYNRWKQQLRNDPNSRVSDEILQELDSYIERGGGKEIWDEVAKTDIKFYEGLLKWKELWPFKRPKTSGGVWIFSGKLATKEYWERVLMTILLKSPETFKDWYKFLNSQGMASGTVQLLATKALSMFVVLPTLETLLKSIIGNAEGFRNSLMDPDVNWVDWEDWSTEWTANMNSNFYTQIKNSDWGQFIDDRTWADEFAHIIVEIIDALNLSDSYDGYGQNEERIKEEIENMEGVPEEVKDAFKKGKPGKPTEDSNSGEDKKEKKKIIPIGSKK
jgi:hypothetical protein